MRHIRNALIGLVLVCLSAVHASAGHLNSAQRAIIRADLQANFAAQLEARDYDSIVAAYNQPASPSFTVWRPSLEPSQYREAITWTELTGRSAGERDMFAFLTGGGSLAINCTSLQVRQAIQDAFSGAGGAVTRPALIAACKRTTTRAEALLATGTGSNATPGLLTFEGAFDMGALLEVLGE